jgi:hypothetical protein
LAVPVVLVALVVLACRVLLLAGLVIAEGFIFGEFTPTKVHLLHILLNGELEGSKLGALVCAITEGLIEALPATAPPIQLLVYFGVLNCEGSHFRTQRFDLL